MQDFNYHNPTKVYFGKTALDNLVHELETQDVSNVLFVYGGGSIFSNLKLPITLYRGKIKRRFSIVDPENWTRC